MKIPVTVAALFSLALLSSCGSSGGGSTSIIPPVQAQSGYSTASISGTYSVLFQRAYGAYIGSFKADGNGNISAGTLTWTNFNTDPYICTGITFTGTYSLQSTAIGTASLTFTGPNAISGCASTVAQTSGSFIIQAGSEGAALLMTESDNTYPGVGGLAGQATKQ